MIVETIATLSADGNSDVEIDTAGYGDHPEVILQVNITGTISIQVLGSLDGTTFVEMIATSTDDQLAAVAMMPFYRFTATGTSGGSAEIKIGRNGTRP